MFKKENKKEECTKTQENTHKKRKLFENREKGQTCKNIQICQKFPTKKYKKLKNAEVSNMFQKDFIDRENKRKKRKRNVIETRKDEVQKRDNR